MQFFSYYIGLEALPNLRTQNCGYQNQVTIKIFPTNKT